MSVPARLAGFAVVLAILFGAGALAGGAVDPDPRGGGSAAEAHGEDAMAGAHPVRGLAAAEDGLRLVVDDPELRPGRPEALRFRIVDDAGQTVRDFDVEHTKRMHVIVARRDLTGFQHLHPRQLRDGSWRAALRVGTAGSYRLFADFTRGGGPVTLATDLRADGAADLRPPPRPTATDTTAGGYRVTLDSRHAEPGDEAELRFSVTRGGRQVRTEPYLGAGGHLVALREGDLAFLHVHPADARRLVFEATFPTAGRYRLFLQFQHAGRVRTAAFTLEAR